MLAGMPTDSATPTHEEAFRRLNEVRAEAIEHTRIARRLAVERRDMINELVGQGVSQAEIARAMGVTRQAVQKMLAC
jgi:DNA-directed RNA polymerase specialized sigma24 family protein